MRSDIDWLMDALELDAKGDYEGIKRLKENPPQNWLPRESMTEAQLKEDDERLAEYAKMFGDFGL